jgi:cytochrome c-type biogenesis protein CcmH
VRRKLFGGLIAAILTVLIVPVALADEPLSPEALEIANNLNCPVCEGQSVRDSNSQLARDMRRIVQEQLDEGYTEDEVYDYFVDRYGVGILRNPPKSGFFMTLWWAPVIGIAIGALILGTFVTQRKRGNKSSASETQRKASTAQSTDDDDDLAEYEAKVLRQLDESNRRDGRG